MRMRSTCCDDSANASTQRPQAVDDGICFLQVRPSPHAVGCGVCALNNALGDSLVSPAQMLAAAKELDDIRASANAEAGWLLTWISNWAPSTVTSSWVTPSRIRQTAGWEDFLWDNDVRFVSEPGRFYPHVLWWSAARLGRRFAFTPPAVPLERDKAYVLNILEPKRVVSESPHFVALFYKPRSGEDDSLLLDSHARGSHVQLLSESDVAELREGATQVFEVGQAPPAWRRKSGVEKWIKGAAATP